jgi:hypothetical protein
VKFFLAAIAKHGAILPNVRENIAQSAAIALPMRHMPFRCEQWSSPSGHMLLSVWDNDLTDVEQRPLIALQGNRATTISGYVGHTGIANGFDQASVLSTISIDSEMIPKLGGSFAILEADRTSDTVIIWNTATRLVPVFHTETDDMVLVGNRALLLSLILTGRPQPDYAPENLVPFLTSGFFASERTPFRNIGVMPANARLVASRQGIQITAIDTFEEDCGTVLPAETDFDDLANNLVNTVKHFRGTDMDCSLTGGKDSRLVVAALHAAGLDFQTHTSGFPDHPDVLVARRISTLLGRTHRHSALATVEHDTGRSLKIDLAARAHGALFCSDGMLSLYHNLQAPTSFAPSPIHLGGVGGESLRGGYAKGLVKQGVVTWERLEQWIKNRFIGKRDAYHPTALVAYDAFLDAWIARERTKGTRPAVAADKFYLTFRTGRWQAASRASDYGNLNWHPLTDNLLTKASLRIHEDVKLNDTLIYELMARLAPELLDVPFADARWTFEKEGPRSWDQVGWELRAPVVSRIGTQGSFNWRTTVTTSLFDVFYDQIFNDQRADALFELVDRAWLRRTMENDRGRNVGTIKVGWYWGVYSASVLLSNTWLDQESPARFVEIPLPPDSAIGIA